jgi:hypothetical protein
VQAGAVVIAVQIANREWEVPERMGPIHDSQDPAGPRDVADLPDWKDVACQVRDVADVHHLRSWRDGLFETLDQIALARWRNRERDLGEDNAIAEDALFPRVQHAAVVLVRGQHFVARGEVDPELRDLQRLARVPRDGKLFDFASRLTGQSATHRFDVRLEHLPHVIHGRLV